MTLDDKHTGNSSDQIQETVKEMAAHAANMQRGVGLIASATPAGLAIFAKLLAQLAKQASVTAEKNLKIATITLWVVVIAAALTLGQLVLALCEHLK